MGAVETLICWENLDIQRVGSFFRLAKQSPKHHQNIIGPSSKRHQNVTIMSWKHHYPGYIEEPCKRGGENPLPQLWAGKRQDPLHWPGELKSFSLKHDILISPFCVQETGVEMELEENMPLLEWLANNYKKFGAGLEIITDRSQVNQLCLKMKQLTTIWWVSAHVLRHLLTDACLFRREASMFEDLVALAECWDTLLTFRYALAVSLYFWNKLYFLFVFQPNCFSQCNATTWTMPTTTWTTTKLSKSSLQLKLFHHKNLHVGSTYLVLNVTKFPGIVVLCLGFV